MVRQGSCARSLKEASIYESWEIGPERLRIGTRRPLNEMAALLATSNISIQLQRICHVLSIRLFLRFVSLDPYHEGILFLIIQQGLLLHYVCFNLAFCSSPSGRYPSVVKDLIHQLGHERHIIWV